MAPIKDLTGRRFGRLVVQSRAPNRDDLSRSERVQWACRCDCGNSKIVSGSSLRSGNTESCGCLHKEVTSKRSLKEMSGMRFGALVVQKRGPSRAGNTMWECICDCGNTTMVYASNLRAGRVRSCGCASGIGHRNEYKRIHGEVPTGYIVTTRDGNPSNISPDNLCALTTRTYDQMLRAIRGVSEVQELRKSAIRIAEMNDAIRNIEKNLV